MSKIRSIKDISRMVYTGIMIMLICSCDEPSHTTEIVEKKVPMGSNGDFISYGSAGWSHAYSTSLLVQDTVQWIPYVNNYFEWESARELAVVSGYQFWGISIQVEDHE